MTIINSTFSENQAIGGLGRGGAIFNNGPSVPEMAITNSTFSGNQGSSGGAIYNNFSSQIITNSTFSGNQAIGGSGNFGEGGAIFQSGTSFSNVTVSNTTFFGNKAINGDGSDGTGGAIYHSGGVFNIKGSILAASTGGNCGVIIGLTAITDEGYNIADDSSCNFIPMGTSRVITPTSNIGLDPAGATNNGGPTQTIALLSGSPAIDGMTDSSCPPPSTDQRGVHRPQEAYCDIGAFEVIQTSSDAILFPYVAVGGTVTTLASVIYTVKEPGSPGASALNYQTWYKPTNPDDPNEVCLEIGQPHPTSPNDIVTFDLGGHFGQASDAKGVLFGDGANSPTKYANYGHTWFDQLALTSPATRGFLIVTDEQNATPTDGELSGEALNLDLVNGAAWGYRGYNSLAPRKSTNPADFSNQVERLGEVLLQGVTLRHIGATDFRRNGAI